VICHRFILLISVFLRKKESYDASLQSSKMDR
jgi:hypothetical protein